MRLDKYIASVTDLSRKQVRAVIRAQHISVDGSIIGNPAHHISERSEVCLSGEMLRKPGFRYLMLHKPAGVVCATRDSHQTTVIDLLELERPENLQIAGRLDIDTTGLVLLTDDGQWNHRLTSPRYQCTKTYLVTTADTIDPATADRFGRGIVLLPENKRTRPAELQILDSHRAVLKITEGRYHQVKRMFAATGNRVVTLHRSAVGKIELDPSLEPGDSRPLTETETASV